MAVREHQGDILQYGMPINGINLYKSLVDLDSDECVMAQNLIYRNGLVGRGGASKLVDSAVNGSNKITGLEALYDSSGDGVILAASNGKIKYKDGSSWSPIDSSLGQNWNSSADVKINQWGALDTIYLANGVDRALRRNSDGSIDEAGKVELTIVDGQEFIDAASATITFTVEDEVTVLLEGRDFSASANENGMAENLAPVVNGISGLTASASGAVVYVTADMESHLQVAESNLGESAITFSNGFLGPPKANQFLNYQDRLMCLDENNPSRVSWSKPYDDSEWETRSATGISIDSRIYGMSVHSIHNKNTGYQAGVLFFGATGVHFFQASDMRVPYTTGDYTIYPISLDIGVDAVKTAKWTPVGTMFLARDKKVYMLPFNTSTPVEISQKIISNLSYLEGIEGIEAGRIADACGVYHDGYYKLSFSRDSVTANDTQFWLEVGRLSKDNRNAYQPWYGPMTGVGRSVFAVRRGPGDKGELISGDESDGVVYLDGDISTLDDDGEAIIHAYQSLFAGGVGGLLAQKSTASILKRTDRCELNIFDTISAATIDFYDVGKQLSIVNSFSSLGKADYYCGGFYCGEAYCTTNSPTKVIIPIDPLIEFYMLSATILHSVAGEKFELHNFNVHLTQEDLVIQDANVT
jgi:hypothetical protein|tara:strand:+ start:5446 stop:7365 length:1920 start_codon:yes stop_codon:yes gene_type:complete